jgi:hypothetical protein
MTEPINLASRPLSPRLMQYFGARTPQSGGDDIGIAIHNVTPHKMRNRIRRETKPATAATPATQADFAKKTRNQRLEFWRRRRLPLHGVSKGS